MRQVYWWSPTAAGQRWPEGQASAMNLPSFNWLKIDNRGANPVVFGPNANVANDLNDAYGQVSNGKVRVLNVAGPKVAGPDGKLEEAPNDQWWQELHLLSVTGATTVVITISDHPIVDFVLAT